MFIEELYLYRKASPSEIFSSVGADTTYQHLWPRQAIKYCHYLPNPPALWPCVSDLPLCRWWLQSVASVQQLKGRLCSAQTNPGFLLGLNPSQGWEPIYIWHWKKQDNIGSLALLSRMHCLPATTMAVTLRESTPLISIGVSSRETQGYERCLGMKTPVWT